MLDDGIWLADGGGGCDVMKGGIWREMCRRGRPQKRLVNVRHGWLIEQDAKTKYARSNARRDGGSAVWIDQVSGEQARALRGIGVAMGRRSTMSALEGAVREV